MPGPSPSAPPAFRLPAMRSLLLVDPAAGEDPAVGAASPPDGIVLAAGQACPGDFRGRPGVKHPPVQLVSLRLAPVETPSQDLSALVAEAPDGVLVSGFAGPPDLVRLAALLAAAEAMAGLEDGALGIVAVLDNPAAFLVSAGYRDAARGRLSGLAWDAAALAAAIGARQARTPQGRLIPPADTARALCLMAASAAGVPAYDTVNSTSDINALRLEAESARQSGFTGKLAARPEQVAVINLLFDSNR